VSRALRALSSTYVERRSRLSEGAALAGRGKRAAFALFYGPLHYLLVREIVHALPEATAAATTLVDAGCGSGAAGAAWARAFASPPRILGIDRHPWAVDEASWTYRALGLVARVRRHEVTASLLPKPPALILGAFSMNELDERARDALLRHLLNRAGRGDRILIVEPLAGFVAPWWNAWRDAFVARRGRADMWRFRLELPSIVSKLDRSAGLDHRDLTARSLWLAR
jgi:hypothetical protein